jgi:hypothetical protein
VRRRGALAQGADRIRPVGGIQPRWLANRDREWRLGEGAGLPAIQAGGTGLSPSAAEVNGSGTPARVFHRPREEVESTLARVAPTTQSDDSDARRDARRCFSRSDEWHLDFARAFCSGEPDILTA